MENYTIHPHDENSFEIRNAKDEPLGWATLANDECRWYAVWNDLEEGGPTNGDLRPTRQKAINDILAASAAGLIEIIVCS